ncbi:hypothetical protein [Methanococcus sp. CF]
MDPKDFQIICKKCGSTNVRVDVIYRAASTTVGIECRDCTNEETEDER